MPLAFVPEGKKVTVSEVRAGPGMLRRLSSMGLHPSSCVEVVCADRGSLIVSVAGCRYALSRGMAMKVLVQEAGA
ncbi:MAG: FeoA family protein [Methanoregulaceae archaeon]|jgi:ferrous iron transport protein A